MAGTTIVDRLNKLSGKDATTIPKALEYLEEEGVGGDVDWNVNDPEAKGYISNRPFYEYDDYEEEEAVDLLDLLGEYASGLEYDKYTNSEKTFYQTNVYTNYALPNFRESFEEGEEYNLVFGTNSTVIPSFETGYSTAIFAGSSDWEGPYVEYENQVTFHNNHNDKSVELCSMVGGYRDTAAIFAGFDVDDDGTLPNKLRVTSIKAYKRIPVKKVKKIDEKYLPIKGLNVHICTSEEYDSSTRVPTVTNPDASTLYLVPTSSKSKNMFDEYVWTGTDWEKFGTGSVALPSPTTADNGKVLGVDGGEYKLGEARTDIPTANLSRAGQVLGVGNTGKYTFMDKEPSIEKIVLNGAYAYKYGKLAIVSYTHAGISFPAMVNGSGGLYVVSGSMEVDYDKIGSSGVLGYGYDTTDKTKRYAVAVTASTASGKDTFFLLDVDTMTSVSTNKTFFGMFFIPCK